MADQGPIIVAAASPENADPELGLTNNLPPPPDYGTSVNPTDTPNDTPPPAYDDLTKEAPPSYQAIFGQMQDAKNSSSTPAHFVVKIISIFMNTLLATVVLAIMLAVPIAMIVIGALYKDQCPVEPKIPMYLIVTGCFYILKSLVDLYVRYQRRNLEGENTEENSKENTFSRMIGCFLFVFFIVGNVWVYSNWKPSDDPNSPQYCYGPLFYFAFWLITSCYIVIALACCCVCCAAGATAAVSE